MALNDLVYIMTHTKHVCRVQLVQSLPAMVVCVCACRIEGHQGVAMDDLVYIMTHLARQAEADGFDKVFNAAESATKAIEVCWMYMGVGVGVGVGVGACVCVCVCVIYCACAY